MLDGVLGLLGDFVHRQFGDIVTDLARLPCLFDQNIHLLGR